MSSWALKRLEQKFSTDKHKLCRKINPSLKKIKQQVIKFTTRFSVLLRVKLLKPIHRKSSRKSLHVSQKNPQTLVSHFIFTRSPLEMKNPKFKRLYLLDICHFYQKYEGERGEWKSYLKAQHYKNSDYGIQSHHFMANRRGKVKAVTDFIFLGSKITVDDGCSHKIKRHLLLGRKAMTNLDSVLKSRDITLLTKVHLVKAMVFVVT